MSGPRASIPSREAVGGVRSGPRCPQPERDLLRQPAEKPAENILCKRPPITFLAQTAKRHQSCHPGLGSFLISLLKAARP